MSFALPGKAEYRGNTEGTTRLYEVGVGGVGLWVSFTEDPAADYSADGLEQAVVKFVEKVKSSGAVDVVESRRHTTFANRPAVDTQLSFTARDGKRNIGFVRVIGDGKRAVQLQSIAFVDPGTEASATPIVEEYHRRLITGIRMP